MAYLYRLDSKDYTFFCSLEHVFKKMILVILEEITSLHAQYTNNVWNNIASGVFSSNLNKHAGTIKYVLGIFIKVE